ncbi:hypothetical protein BDV93DRAFT_553392 [Ceratobasidium sp. AG-I]|nr:hypothetical protein BDV93DRAFT_553392 [Ceratobasidium sp. AG-I]
MSQQPSIETPISPRILVNHSSERPSLNSKPRQTWLQLRAGMPGRLWTVYAIVMVAFFLVRIQFTFPGGLSKNLDPSEYFQFRIPRNKLFLWLHLVSVLPAALLAVLQLSTS